METKQLVDLVYHYLSYESISKERCKIIAKAIVEDILKSYPIEPDIPMREMSASYMQVRDLTDEEWLQLPKKEVIQLYKNCYEILTQFTTQRQEITYEEIEKEADLQYSDTTIIPETAFIAGAKWMRDKMR